MAANAQHDFNIFPDEISFEELDRQSVEITDGYNAAADPGFDLGLFEEPEYNVSGPRGIPEPHKAAAKEKNYFPLVLSVCVCFVVLFLSACMFMIQKQVDAHEHLEDMKSTLTAYREDSRRIDTEIRRICEMGAVASYAESQGLHKASQYQVVYVGGNSRQGGIVSNAGELEYETPDVWDRLNSFLD